MRPRTMDLSLVPGGEPPSTSSVEGLKPPSFHMQPRNARKESSWPEP